MLTTKQLLQATEELSQWLDWDVKTIEYAHAYCQRFYPGRAGSNVYMLMLEDALSSRGITLDQFRADMGKNV